MLRLFVPGPVKPHSGQFSVSEPEPARSSAPGRGTLGARTAAMRHLRLLLRPREFFAEFLGSRQLELLTINWRSCTRAPT